MAIGKASDFKVYQAEMQGGVVETLTQASQALSGGSNGAILLSTVSRRGDYAKDAFFKNIASLVTRRDTTSVSAATDLAMTMDEIISVKLNRKVGPVAQTLDAFRKIESSVGSPEEFSFLLGGMVGKAMQIEMLNSALRAGRAALDNQSDVTYTVPTSGTLNTAGLVSGLAKFGDAASGIVAWVMHSKQYYDLVQAQITANVDGVSNFNIQTGLPVTLNRPVIVTDSSALIVTAGSGSAATTDYYCLGLTANGLVVENTEQETMHAEIVTGLENLVMRLQGEFAFNAGVKGFKWDVTNGGANPSDTAVGTGTNWDAAASSFKDYAGVVIQSR